MIEDETQFPNLNFVGEVYKQSKAGRYTYYDLNKPFLPCACLFVCRENAKVASSSKRLLCHDKVKVLESDLIPVGCSSLEHFSELISRHCLAQFFGHSTQIMDVDSC